MTDRAATKTTRPTDDPGAARDHAADTLWRRRGVRIAAALVLYTALAAAATYFTPGAYGPAIRLQVGIFVAFSAFSARAACMFLAPRVGVLTAWVAVTIAWSLATTALAIATGSCGTGEQGCTPAAAASWMVVGASWVAVQFTVAASAFLARRAVRGGWRVTTLASSLIWHGSTPSGPRGRTQRAENAAASRSGSPAVRATAKAAPNRTAKGNAKPVTKPAAGDGPETESHDATFTEGTRR